MNDAILDLLSDDYYLLWEVRDVARKSDDSASNEMIMDSVIDLVGKGVVVCYVSPGLGVEGLIALNQSEATRLIRREESWLVPSSDGADIIRITAAADRWRL